MRESTRIIRSTLTRTEAGEPLHPGPVFAAPYHTPGDPSDTPYTYARSHNPTWTHLEKAIAQLESGEGYRASALVFASGMAACAAVFGAILRPGDIVVLPSNAYFAARVLAQEYFSKMGVVLRLAPTANNAQADRLQGAKLLWLETPSNPTMDVCDIALLTESAHRAGALVAVDNTTPTPLGQSPLALGADFSVASDTKALTGHSDILLGHVAVRDLELRQKIDQWRTLTGGILGPMEAWLALRSIATLPLRLERSCHNAQRIAEFLVTRPEITSVLYPGLPSHPSHAIAKKQMRYFGPVLSFILHDKAAAETFLSKSKLLTEATSFGGVTSTAERRARWGGDVISEGFIRLSAGCEDIEDLLEDIAQALDATHPMIAPPYWINSHLAIVLKPWGDKWLDDEMLVLRAAGLDLIVSMLQQKEAHALGLAEEEASANRAGLLFANFPIQDRCVPPDKPSFLNFLETLENHLASGRRIGIHCRGSIGRAPLTVASLLIRSGISPEAAWAQIATCRDCDVPDTEEQRQWVDRHMSPNS